MLTTDFPESRNFREACIRLSSLIKRTCIESNKYLSIPTRLNGEDAGYSEIA